MKLIDTIEMMKSEDYKERFKAEYYQAKIRNDKLYNMITKYKAGNIDFEPICQLDVLEEQFNYMSGYLRILEIRAKLEKIEL